MHCDRFWIEGRRKIQKRQQRKRLPGAEAAMPAQQVCVKVDELIVILRHSDRSLDAY
jgi:hypothetical protein